MINLVYSQCWYCSSRNFFHREEITGDFTMLMIQLLPTSLFIICIGGFVETAKVEDLKVLTYNAALLQSSITSNNDSTVPINRDERLEAIIQYLKEETDADLVCLQEAPFGQDVERIVNEVSMKYPYSFSELHQPDGFLPPHANTIHEPSCEPVAFNALTTCIFANGCLTGMETTQVPRAAYNCFLAKCEPEINNLIAISGEKCLTCIIFNSPPNYFRCAGNTSPLLWNINKLGLVLLSKIALYGSVAVEFYPNVVDTFVRGYLHAKVGNNDLSVVCVHVTAPLLQLPTLNRQFRTLKEQSAAETQELVHRFLSVEPSVVLGDFNTGPRSLSINPFEEPNYELLASVFTTELVKEPTYSADNAYNNGTTTPDVAIDHVFGSRFVRVSNVEVVLKEDEISVGEHSLPLSDHYGVEAIISVCRPRRRHKHR